MKVWKLQLSLRYEEHVPEKQFSHFQSLYRNEFYSPLFNIYIKSRYLLELHFFCPPVLFNLLSHFLFFNWNVSMFYYLKSSQYLLYLSHPRSVNIICFLNIFLFPTGFVSAFNWGLKGLYALYVGPRFQHICEVYTQEYQSIVNRHLGAFTSKKIQNKINTDKNIWISSK